MGGIKMKREDFWYNPEAESAGAIPTGARAGQFLFLSAQTSIDLDTGKIIRDLVDLPPEVRDKLELAAASLVNAYFGPIMTQTWTIYQNLSKILAKQGASLKDIIRQRIYVRDTREIGWMEKVMLSFFPEEKPATLILGVPNRGLHEDIRMWMDAIALIPQEGSLQKEAIYLPELEKVTAPYPQAVKVGQFLFFEGLTGVNPKTGRPVTTLEELGSDAKSLWAEERFITGASEATRCQYWFIFNDHLRNLLESQGAGLKDLLVVEGFSRHGMRALCDREYFRGKLFKSIQESPESFFFGNYRLSVIPDVEILYGGVGLLPGEYQKEVLEDTTPYSVGTYSAMTKAGPLYFTGGLGVNVERKQHIISFADLPGNGRFLAQGCIDDNQPVMAKTLYNYHLALEKAKAKVNQIIHQTVYLKNPSDWPAVQMASNTVFNGHIPPTTIVPVDEMVFYWQYRMPVPESIGGENVEIQTWGLTETLSKKP